MMNKDTADAIRALSLRLDEMALAISSLNDQVAGLQQATGTKQRGPKVERAMTDADAYRVKFGDRKDLSHKDAAADLGLSYGQVFSCRGGYTFKHVKPGTRNDDGSELAKEEGGK